MIKLNTKNNRPLRRNISCGILLAFVVNAVLMPVSPAFGQEAAALPLPGDMVSEKLEYSPVVLRGLQYFSDDPLKFNFIIDAGEENLAGQALTDESQELIKYFLASLTVPDKNMWVNLSPDEKDRIIPDGFGSTKMGMTLLAQDYLLKQLAASLTNPDTDLGKEYWAKVGNGRDRSLQNKVWIVPDIAKIYRQDDKVFVAQAHLKVMLAEDLTPPSPLFKKEGESGGNLSSNKENHLVTPSLDKEGEGGVLKSSASSDIFRSTILPTIEKQVNEGKDFAPLRQVYHSLILAVWFKKHLRESFLGKNYVQQNKIVGVETDDLSLKEKIYGEYLQSFEKGIYNIIKEEVDPQTQEMIPRKYFSGGVDVTNLNLEEKTSVVAGSALEVEGVQKGRAYQVLTYLGLNRESKNRSFVAALSVSLLFHFFVLWGPQGNETHRIESAPSLEAVLVSLPDVKKSAEQQASNSAEQKESKPLIMRMDGKPLGEGFLDPNDSLSSNRTTAFIEGVDPKNPFGLSEEERKRSPHALLGANGEVVDVPIGQAGIQRLTRKVGEKPVEQENSMKYVPQEPISIPYTMPKDEYVPQVYSPPNGFAPIVNQLKPISIPKGQKLAMEDVKGLPGTKEVAVRNMREMGDMLNRAGVWKEHPAYQGQVVSPQKVDELLTSTGDIHSDYFGEKKDSLFTAYNFTADELARFFNQAGDKLSREEKEFRNFLEKNGVIKNQGGKFVEDKNVNILVHPNDLREDDANTVREHEKGHALYESDKQYQQEVSKVKQKLSAKEQEFLKKLLTHMGYHEVSHDREFAEYFTDTDLLLHHFRRIFSDQYDRSQSPERRNQAKELAAEMFKEKTVSKRESGQFFKDFMKEFLSKTMTDLAKAKTDAQKRKGIADTQAKPADMSFLNTNIIPHFDPGGIGLDVTRVQIESFQGNKKEIIDRLAQGGQKVSAQDQKQARAALERFIKDQGYADQDVFVVSQDYFENDAWDVELVRKQGETSLQEVVGRRLTQVPASEKNNVQSILKAVSEVLAQKSYAHGESLIVKAPVNVSGEPWELIIELSGGRDRAWEGKKKVRDEPKKVVNIRFIKNDRPQGWRGNLYASQSGTDFSKAFDEALRDFNKTAASKGIVSIAPLGESTKVLTLDEIQAKRLNLIQPEYKNQRIEFLTQVDIAGRVFDLHVVQSQETGGYETRLAIEIPGAEYEYAQTVGNLGVRHNGAGSSMQGFTEAVKMLKPKIEAWLKEQKQSPKSVSSSLDIEPPGGIDLNPQNWQLEEQTDRPASSVILFDPENSAIVPFSGITPIIIQTTPVSLPLLLGLSSTPPAEDVSLVEVR